MTKLIALIIVGALGFRGACKIMHNVVTMRASLVPPALMVPPGRNIVHIYMVAAIPVAFLNGYLLNHSWVDCVLVGFGTWAGMLVANILFRFSEIFQFFIFGLVNLCWLTVNIYRALFN